MRELVRFRWIAIAMILVGMIPLLKWGYLDKRHLVYIIAVLSLLTLVNLLSPGVWRNSNSQEKLEVSLQKNDQLSLFMHLCIDLLAATGLLFVTGSAENPFVSILCVNAFLGGMLLKPKWSAGFASLVFALLGLLQVETYMNAVATVGTDFNRLFISFLSQWLAIAGAWFVSFHFSKASHRQLKTIQSLREEQFQADRMKALGALAAGLSHELATPMNALKLRLDRAIRKLDQSDSVVHEELHLAKVSLDDSVDVFQRMKTLFSSSSDLKLEQVEVLSLLQRLVNNWAGENPTVTIKTQFGEGPVFVKLQAISFARSIFDILDNALESHMVKNAEVSIQVRAFSDEGFFYIQIIDQGVGISEEILSRLGEPFVTTKESGSGLGVYSTQLMTQASGGNFILRNNKNSQGATAIVTLPRPVEVK